MITSRQCLDRYGPPKLEKAMVLYDVPTDMEIGVIPKRVYCNKEIAKPLANALKLIIARGLVDELKTWDGCFYIRRKKGSSTPSLHSWGLAIDINASWNGFGKPPRLSRELVQCFTESGFEWGGYWSNPDGMHFQLAKFPS